jgi:predicted DNA-binding protein (MmcQ/YjbR family)
MSDPLANLRRLCLELPEATEKLSWGHVPTFRVRDKIFAQYETGTHGEGRPSLWCKAAPGAQEVLVGADPKRFFIPAYVGHHGWIGAWLDGDVDWEQLAPLIEDSYRMTATKRHAALLDGAKAQVG